jgi:hypothetical protein
MKEEQDGAKAEVPAAKKQSPWPAVLGTVIILLLLAGGALAILHFKPHPPLPKTVSSQADFPLFYPKPLPGTYTLQKDSPKYNEAVIYYELNNQDGKAMKISEQARPADVTSDSLLNGREVSTNYGKAKVVTAEKETTALLFTDKTMVFIRVANPIASSDIDQMLLALRPL